MNSVNSKNMWFIILFLIVLGVSFGVISVVGSFDSSSMYTELFHHND